MTQEQLQRYAPTMAPETARLICELQEAEIIREGIAGERRGIEETMETVRRESVAYHRGYLDGMSKVFDIFLSACKGAIPCPKPTQS